ncbi:MAG: hypothetical protein ACYCQJ_16345 [Nitrososphaerales archaeon]
MLKIQLSKSLKQAWLGLLSMGILLMGTLTAHATMINYEGFSLSDQSSNIISVNSTINEIGSNQGNFYNPASYPQAQSVGPYTQTISNGSGSISVTSNASASMNSVQTVNLDTSGTISNTFSSLSGNYGHVGDQSVFTGIFVGQGGSVSLPFIVNFTESGNINVTGGNSTIEVRLIDDTGWSIQECMRTMGGEK